MATVTADSAIAQKIEQIEHAGENEAEGIKVRVLPMNEGLAYYKFTYLILRDVRIVFAPPKNIGFFGGDPDNFEWPRHDGDFTFMRAYVGQNGKPAEYATGNVPFKPKKFLHKILLKSALFYSKNFSRCRVNKSPQWIKRSNR